MSTFMAVSACEKNPAWEQLIQREDALYEHDQSRDEFDRDYTRILHSTAFRRLKHKTQVFPNVENDHICTRMEHVLHVESVAYTIAKVLGLSTSLVRAIAVGHDIGHAPLGHKGEKVLSDISMRERGIPFWHEQNGVRFADKIELLEDPWQVKTNLKLTYAVRDGIISHCGEVDHNGLKPRDGLFSLDNFIKPGQFESATWEGCIVKMADKIAYLGRDIEDAKKLGIIGEKEIYLYTTLQKTHHIEKINTTSIITGFIKDICDNSTPEKGICFSDEAAEVLKGIKTLNYQLIYNSDRFQAFCRYATLVLDEVYDALKSCYTGDKKQPIRQDYIKIYPTLVGGFENYVQPYLDVEREGFSNKKIYGDLTEQNLFVDAIFDYIAGMTDDFLIRAYNELIQF